MFFCVFFFNLNFSKIFFYKKYFLNFSNFSIIFLFNPQSNSQFFCINVWTEIVIRYQKNMCAPIFENLGGNDSESEGESDVLPEPTYPQCFMCGDTRTPGRVSVPPTYEVVCMRCSAERLQPAHDSVMRTFEEALRNAEATRLQILSDDSIREELLARERRRVARRDVQRFNARRSIRRADARIAAFRAARRN